MKQQDWRYGVGVLGLFLGLVFGFFLDAILEATTGNVVRRGLGTDAHRALLYAFVGGSIGLSAGIVFGEYLGGRRKEPEGDDSN